jgi:hypothetical protein
MFGKKKEDPNEKLYRYFEALISELSRGTTSIKAQLDVIKAELLAQLADIQPKTTIVNNQVKEEHISTDVPAVYEVKL